MKISIITVTYNSAETIADCITSVANQTYGDIEHLIVDGASTDDTVELIEAQAGEFVKILSEPDNGLYDAINKGIILATGDIIGILHSDDLYASNDILEQVVERMEMLNADILYGDLLYVDRDNADKIIRYWESKDFSQKQLSRGWMPAHPTVFARKEVYDKWGSFDLQYKIAADYDFLVRILQDNSLNVEYLPEVITKMRVGGASNKSLRNIIRKSKEDYMIMRRREIRFPMRAIVYKNLSKLGQFLKK